MQFLLDTDVTYYIFIDEKVVRSVRQQLHIVPIRFLRSRHVRCFNEEDAKLITHVIYPVLTMQNHGEITASMLIIKIGEHHTNSRSSLIQ